MLLLLCVSFRDAEGCDGLGRPVWFGRVKRRAIAKGCHGYYGVIVLPLVEASLLATRARALSPSSRSVK